MKVQFKFSSPKSLTSHEESPVIDLFEMLSGHD